MLLSRSILRYTLHAAGTLTKQPRNNNNQHIKQPLVYSPCPLSATLVLISTAAMDPSWRYWFDPSSCEQMHVTITISTRILIFFIIIQYLIKASAHSPGHPCCSPPIPPPTYISRKKKGFLLGTLAFTGASSLKHISPCIICLIFENSTHI